MRPTDQMSRSSRVGIARPEPIVAKRLGPMALQKSLDTSPLPINRLYQYAWWNPKYNLPGQYNPHWAVESAIAMACVSWLWRALKAAPLRVYIGEKELEDDARKDALRPILEPNSRHTYSNFLWQTIRDLIANGEVITRNLDSNSLQVLPWESIVQQMPTQAGVSIRYKSQTLNYTEDIPEKDITKILWQPNADHAYLGVSPLEPAYAELQLDRFARDATAGRLQSPVVGLLFQPKEVDGAILPQSDLEELSAEMDRLKGTGVGDAFVGEARYDVKELKGIAHQFNYSLIYSLCESRICGLLGVPPVVAQMGVGLAQTRVGATMREEIRLAYQNGAMPVAGIIAEGWSNIVLPATGRMGYTVEFDFSDVNHLTEMERLAKIKALSEMLAVEGLPDENRAAIMEEMAEVMGV